MDMRCAKILGSAAMCVVALFCLMAVSVPGIANARSASAAMTNSDVVKLVKVGFDDSVVEAKIAQAPDVNFAVDVPALSRLKAEGVPQPVIAAMLKRSTASSQAPAPAHTFGPGLRGAPGLGQVLMVGQNGSNLTLESVGGTAHKSGYIFARMSDTFPGAKASARTHDQQPAFEIDSQLSPNGRVKLVTMKSNAGKNERTLELGHINGFTGGDMNYMQPNASAEVAFTLVQTGQGSWRLTPKEALAPGEYGVLFLGQLFGFGVDP
jgi:hypothetical protein